MLVSKSECDKVLNEAAEQGDQQWWWVPTVTPATFRRLPDFGGPLRQLFDALAIHSLIVVPLRAGGHLHGALALARTTARPPFSAVELAAAQTIGRQAAVAIAAAAIAEGVNTGTAKRARLDDALRKWTRVFYEAGWGAAIVDGEDYRIDVANSGFRKQSDGYSWAESMEGQGTTVTVCLPEVKPAAPDAGAAHPPSRQPETGTVLVIEDEEGVRQLASRILQQVGFRVLEAPTGAAALAVLGDPECPVDLIVTDVVIPDVELSRLEREAHDRWPDLPILYMSGYPHDEIVQRGLVASDQPFLQKPFTAMELTDRVHDLVGARRSGGRR
jgi:CheY-like chemotaxis protein